MTLSDAGLEVYRLLDGIFGQTIDLYDQTRPHQSEPTGTWNTVVLIFSGNQEVKIHDFDSGDLHVLYRFVDEKAGTAHQIP